MRKNVLGRKLRRTTNQRKGLFRSLIRAMVLEERIKTTEAKAKTIRPQLEKLVTRARNERESARRELLKSIPQIEVVDKLITEIAPRFDGRPGGYTRIIRLGGRVKDNAPMVYLEWVEMRVQSSESKVQNKKDESKEMTTAEAEGPTEKNKKTLKTKDKKETKKAEKKGKDKKSV